MFKPQMIEDEKDFHCVNKHEDKNKLVVLDENIERKQRIWCSSCMQILQTDARVVGIKIIIKKIEDVIETNVRTLEAITSNTIQKIKLCITSVQEIKRHFMKLFDSIIRTAEDWTQNLQSQRQKFNQYSFYDELDNLINKENKNLDSHIKLITTINKSWITKLSKTLIQFNQNKDKLNLQKFYEQIMNIGQSNLSQQYSIKLQLINQSVKQWEKCQAIVFNRTGSIMVSTEKNDIKVWSFLNGTINILNTLQGHTDQVLCIVYSNKQDSLISCSQDKTIRCWQLDLNEWNCSQPYQQHTDSVICIVLNSNEDLLFSGSFDKSIKVWKVDFNQNKLKFLYSLNNHNNDVVNLSLNQSENLLVSCAKGYNQIIIWERKEEDKFEFKYFVTQPFQEYGHKVKFIKENQFILVTNANQIDKIFIFERTKEDFQVNQSKTIHLLTNNKIYDEYHFPIIYNKERNLIVLRYKMIIYILREFNDGKYNIVDQLSCATFSIYGTITNNGQYLVYWDNKNQGYSIYELQNK
ncbi:unnamed protein product (macronuclear) [Paramecium tetraurelia]|uniref:Uncharacterized protein n=1 Tax=Paramecium tetraurelia TaxID=5888 RepID=A0C150_PARTE|nr:uncharacterized protein GSPATT00033993001 [Paramecium tetraurelia]CAK64517.1 unnamed protein product [Paramecium tetraurelia]|eukprot:XP_001431915.1 hypothetical protein (macronuclear) [Paramecium tetraurelia strain d4-2]